MPQLDLLRVFRVISVEILLSLNAAKDLYWGVMERAHPAFSAVKKLKDGAVDFAAKPHLELSLKV